MNRNLQLAICTLRTAAALAVSITTPARAQPIEWPISEGGNGHFYESALVGSPISFSDARIEAAARGGYLVTFTSREEHEWVFQTVVSNPDLWHAGTGGGFVGPHIGLWQDHNDPNYHEPDGGWRWVTEEEFAYSAWDVASGQPNNAGNGQDFGYYFTRDSEPRPTWGDGEDFSENGPISYIVEYDAPAIELVVQGSCPGGGPIEVAWAGATPDSQTALIFSLETGNLLIPTQHPCQGTRLGLGPNQIQLVGVYRTDAEGNRTVRGFAGNGACGGFLQVLDVATCGTSSVSVIE